MAIGERIKQARERKDMTQDQVAKLLNTTKQTIFKYENNIVTNIPYEKIILLSEVLNVSPSYLFGWEEKTPTPKSERDGSEIMFALSRGGEVEITEEMFEEVKRFAAYLAQREDTK